MREALPPIISHWLAIVNRKQQVCKEIFVPLRRSYSQRTDLTQPSPSAPLPVHTRTLLKKERGGEKEWKRGIKKSFLKDIFVWNKMLVLLCSSLQQQNKWFSVFKMYPSLSLSLPHRFSSKINVLFPSIVLGLWHSHHFQSWVSDDVTHIYTYTQTWFTDTKSS